MPGRMVPRLRRRGRHPGPCPSAVPGADERPAPHLRHHLPEPERRATRRRGGGPGEGRQVPPEPLGYSSPEPGGTAQQQQQLFALRAVLEELAGRMVPVDMGRPPSIRSILLFQLQDRPRRRHPSGVSGGPLISCRFSSVSFGPLVGLLPVPTLGWAESYR